MSSSASSAGAAAATSSTANESSKEKESGRKRTRDERDDDSDSYSDSDSESDSDSDSDSERDRKRRKKEKKKRKKRKKEKKKKKKKKKSKKSKKNKKKHKKKKRRRSDSYSSDDDESDGEARTTYAGAVDQSQYGAYGIIRDSDMYEKQPEFELWCKEIKGKDLGSIADRREERELFSSFMEDYNTATMPHVKYYNVAKYEAEKRAKAAAKQAKLYAEGKGKAPLRSALDDEQERERERRERIAKRKRDETYASLMALRSSDAAKNAMRENARLRATMTTAYKMGDMATYNKIKEQLEMTDEEAAKRNLNKEDQYLQGRRAV